jgi:hypothetical protein
VSNRDRLVLTPDFTTRWATGNYNCVYSSLWDFKSSFTCRKILHGTFPLYFPSERKVLRIFIALKSPSPWPGFEPQTLGPVASTLTTTPPRRLTICLKRFVSLFYDVLVLNNFLIRPITRSGCRHCFGLRGKGGSESKTCPE